MANAPAPPGEAEVSLAVAQMRLHPDFVRAVADIRALGLLTEGFDPQPTAKSTQPSYGTQPAKSAMALDSGILRAETESAVRHVQEAATLQHPLTGLAAVEPADLFNAAQHVASFVEDPEKLLIKRGLDRNEIQRIADSILHLSSGLRRLMTPSVLTVASTVHLALLDALSQAMEWPDTDFVNNFVLGFPIVGYVPPSHVPAFRKVPRTETTDIGSLQNSVHNARVARRILKQKDDPSQATKAEVMWQSAMDEKDKGQCQGPFYSTQALNDKFGGRDSWRCMERFGVEQERADGSTKVRGCDNAASSKHNECTDLGETITCESVDFPLRMAAMFSQLIDLDVPWSMALGTDDVEAAYRRLPCATPQFSVVALLDPHTGMVAYFTVPGLCFGLTASVNQFNRLPELIVAACRRIFGLVNSHYVDDYPTCEPSYAKCSAQTTLRLLHSLIGIPLAPSKHVRMGCLTVFMGVTHDFSRFALYREVTMRPKEGRVEKICKAVTALCAANATASPAQLSSLRGKLQFVFSVAFYRIGRPALYAISRFQRTHRRQRVVPQYLRSALEFLLAVLPHLPPRLVSMRRRVQAAMRPPTIIWSDAMWTPSIPAPAQVGFVVWEPPNEPSSVGTFTYGHRVLTSSELAALEERGNQILPLELLAVACVYETLGYELRDREVIHFIDNAAALSNSIRGSAKREDCARIVCSTHLALARARIIPWFAYVASKANVSDLPSRGLMAEMIEVLESAFPGSSTNACEVAIKFPNREAWDAAASEAPIPTSLHPQKRTRRGSKRKS